MTDPEFHDFCMDISAQKFDSCSEKEIDKQVLEMVAKGNLHNKNTVSNVKANGIKPSMASNIYYTHDFMNWFHEQKRVVQTYDINYGAEARHEDGPYTDSHMYSSDWKLNEHSVAIFHPSATVVNDIDGKLYVMCSLVVPSTYMLIQKA